MKDIVKKYSNGDITIVWRPAKCMHAAECVKALPNVYDPKKRPWITAENATSRELRDQVALCPSGALSILEDEQKLADNTETSIDVMANGPLIVHGNIKVNHGDATDEKSEKTAFCRCGASSNKPYCDGSHMKIEFKG